MKRLSSVDLPLISGEAPELGRQRARLLDRNGDGMTGTCASLGLQRQRRQ